MRTTDTREQFIEGILREVNMADFVASAFPVVDGTNNEAARELIVDMFRVRAFAAKANNITCPTVQDAHLLLDLRNSSKALAHAMHTCAGPDHCTNIVRFLEKYAAGIVSCFFQHAIPEFQPSRFGNIIGPVIFWALLALFNDLAKWGMLRGFTDEDITAAEDDAANEEAQWHAKHIKKFWLCMTRVWARIKTILSAFIVMKLADLLQLCFSAGETNYSSVKTAHKFLGGDPTQHNIFTANVVDIINAANAAQADLEGMDAASVECEFRMALLPDGQTPEELSKLITIVVGEIACDLHDRFTSKIAISPYDCAEAAIQGVGDGEPTFCFK